MHWIQSMDYHSLSVTALAWIMSIVNKYRDLITMISHYSGIGHVVLSKQVCWNLKVFHLSPKDHLMKILKCFHMATGYPFSPTLWAKKKFPTIRKNPLLKSHLVGRSSFNFWRGNHRNNLPPEYGLVKVWSWLDQYFKTLFWPLWQWHCPCPMYL